MNASPLLSIYPLDILQYTKHVLLLAERTSKNDSKNKKKR